MVNELVSEWISLLYKLLRGYRNSIFLIILSLSFIQTTVVSICLILDSNNEVMFDHTKKELDEKNEFHFKANIRYELDPLSFPVETIDQILEDLNKTLIQVNLDSYINGSWINPAVYFQPINFSKVREVGLVFYFEENKANAIMKLLISGSRLPQNANETILVVPEYTKDLFELNSSYYITSTQGDSNSSFPLKVVGILPLLQEENFASYWIYNKYISVIKSTTGLSLSKQYCIIIQKNDYQSVVKKITESSNMDPRELIGRRELYVRFRFDSSALKAHEVPKYLERLEQFENKFERLYSDASVSYSSCKEELIMFQLNWIYLFIEFMIMAFPLLIISLFFTNYVVNNTNLSRLRRTRTLIIRGLSRRVTVILVFIEAVVVFTISNLVGFLMGTVNSIFLIIFMGAAPKLVINPQEWFHYVLFFSGISTGLIYGRITIFVFKFHSRILITGLMKDESIPSRSWANRILIGGGILLLVSIFLFQYIDPSSIPIFTSDFRPIISFIALISLIATFIGTIFSLRTVYMDFFRLISKKTWHKHHNLPALAFKNLNRFFRATSDVWLFLTLLVSYSFILIVYSTSIDHHFKQQAVFNTGADYRVDFQKPDEEALKEFIRHNISEIVSYTRVTLAEMQYRYETISHGGTYWSVKLLGIDPTSFFEVVSNYAQSKFSPSLSSFQQEILVNNYTVGASVGFLEKEDLTIGNSYQLNLLAENYTSGEELLFYHPIANVTVVSSFEIYPLIIFSEEERGMIIHQDFLEGLEHISDKRSSFVMAYTFLIKTRSVITPSKIELLESRYNVEITSIFDEYEALKKERSWDQFLSSQQTNLVISLVLASGCLILYGFFQMNARSREHAIERALGLKKREILKLITSEGFLIVLAALIGGFVVGTLFSSVFLQTISIFSTGGGLRPYVILPLEQFFLYILLFIVIMILSIIPAIILQQKYDIGSLLKRFE